MGSALGSYFRKVRLEKGLRIVELARQSYRNVTKGCRRIGTFEKTGRITPDLLATRDEEQGYQPRS